MARRSGPPPPKPKTPTLTAGQKRRRVERLQKCVTSVQAFDPQKARKRAPAVLELEAAIDKALCSAFGYGTPAYLRYNEAATLDPSTYLANAAARAPVARPADGPVRHDAKAQDTHQQFSENKARAIALLQNAIRTLEDEIASVESVASPPKPQAAPVIAPDPPAKATPKPEVATTSDKASGRVSESLWHRIGRWWRGRPR